MAITELDMAKEGVTVLTIIDDPAPAALFDDAADAANPAAVTTSRAESVPGRAAGERAGWRAWLSIFAGEAD